MKSSLRSQLSNEITKPIYNNTTFIEARNNIETLVSMVEMAYGLPFKHEDSTVAINLVDAQLEQDLSQSPFARDQDWFEMTLILNEERVEYSKGKSLDLELLLNRIRSIFKPIEEEALEDESLQAALIARSVRASTGEFKPRTCPAQNMFKNQGLNVLNRSQTQGSLDSF